MTAPQPPIASSHLASNVDAPTSALPQDVHDGVASARLGSYRQLWWQMRLLVVAALIGCIGLFLFVRQIAASPTLLLHWQPAALGTGIELLPNALPEFQSLEGKTVVAIGRPAERGNMEVAALPSLLLPSARWVLDNVGRSNTLQTQRTLALLAAEPTVRLYLADGSHADVNPRPRGLAQMGVMFWTLSALALLLYLVGTTVLLARLRPRNALFFIMAAAQSGNLLLMAVQHATGIGHPPIYVALDLPLRTALDFITGAAAFHATLLPPLRRSHGLLPALLTWSGVALLSLWIVRGNPPYAWALTQAYCLLLSALSVGSLTLSLRREPNPLALLLRRFASATLITLSLLMLAILSTGPTLQVQRDVAQSGSVLWYVFLASMLLLMPFMSRSQQLLREFALLAGVSTVATSLDLLFVAAFSLSQFASLSLAVFLALGLYAGSRQWVLNHMVGSRPLTAERMFERLYRVVREAESKPEQVAPLLARLLKDMYDPLEVHTLARTEGLPRVAADGTALIVPLLQGSSTGAANEQGAVLLRYAGRGRRMFTDDDARLTAQVVEQVVRAVAFDQAVERGRAEERLRIAQDLHDDIGARLLTLMYQAQTHEMEDYIRHTLQDLKTLTRGLAATDHRLSYAVGEWKADIAQRLAAARIELDWSFMYDQDMMLGMVQWSALTRILRELVSNAIYHACATRLTIDAELQHGKLLITVADNGVGKHPIAWSHGLGLGGVRKRVKLLNGEVSWRENRPAGIVCEVRIARFTGAQ